jgi:uncharacterized protein YndB with AHSA1/START domain
MVEDRIEREIRIEAPIDVVWSVVTEPDQISRWFAPEVQLDARPGAEGRLTFVSRQTGEPASYNLHVERVEPPYHFSFRWVYPDGAVPGPDNAPLVEFTLAEEGDEATRLTLVESGIRAVAWDDAEKERYHESHAEGWDRHLGRLRDHVHETVAG